MKAESNAYKNFKENLSLNSDERVDRVENAMVSGMFDVNYCIGGVEGWVELKAPTEPKRPTTPLFGSNHKVTQDQKNWALRQRMADGIASVLIATDKRWILVGQEHIEQINELTVDQLVAIAKWSANKPVKDKQKWLQLKQTLTMKC